MAGLDASFGDLNLGMTSEKQHETQQALISALFEKALLAAWTDPTERQRTLSASAAAALCARVSESASGPL